ncbi:hypothetical protein BOW53_14445 [Solemya pervernicosa gill symbiont]|uniref:Thioredoxin domain-containing protein n=2 Tax=Gammaproteobacteria incertae sedis TaxID=118884 RepID=A0A1T2L126_9GAMM|nr:thioredoxin family protein [Candidatus Reidiella endopervernicosa]OOZ38720.1 hypothetical protein BOW53_14445 [Solemya pervernicosa gill symbiont]QKQ25831.1 thioredoxin family protein [Candidatus Reidiella endopervernicosa]
MSELIPWGLGGIALLFVLFQLRIVITSKRMAGTRVEGLDQLVGSSESCDGRYLFYFHSPRCGPCRTMTPEIEALAEKRSCIIKLDVSRDINAAMALGVRATPTVVLVKDGAVEKVLLGGQSIEKLEALLG